MTLFIALNVLREEQDPSLQFDFACRSCPADCKTCYRDAPGQCTSCKRGFFLQGGDCVPTCNQVA